MYCRILEFVWEASPQPSSFAQSIWEGQEVSCHSQFRSLIMKYILSLMETERSDHGFVDIISQYLKLVKLSFPLP